MRINPITFETVGITAGNTGGWKYLTTQTTTRGTSQACREGVQIRNVGTSSVNAVLSIQGLTLGDYTGATGGVGFPLASQTEIFLPISDLSTIVVKTDSASVSAGITLAFIAY